MVSPSRSDPLRLPLKKFKSYVDSLKPGRINLRNKNGQTLLAEAAWWGYPDKVRILIEFGADPDIKDKNGNTALSGFHLNKKNRLTIVKILIDAGADVNLSGWRGTTPLMKALDDGDVKVTDVLLRAGADIRKKNSIGMTVLESAEAHLLLNKIFGEEKTGISRIEMLAIIKMLKKK